MFQCVCVRALTLLCVFKYDFQIAAHSFGLDEVHTFFLLFAMLTHMVVVIHASVLLVVCTFADSLHTKPSEAMENIAGDLLDAEMQMEQTSMFKKTSGQGNMEREGGRSGRGRER